MECCCIDIANCTNDIAILENALAMIQSAQGTYATVSEEQMNIITIEETAYELDENLRTQMIQEIKTAIQSTENDFVASVYVFRDKISELQKTLTSLIRQDNQYHASQELIVQEEYTC